MPSYLVCRQIHNRTHFKCEICLRNKLSKVYEYQNISYVRGYEPPFFNNVCEQCVYMKVFGPKNWKKEKKKGTLDGNV